MRKPARSRSSIAMPPVVPIQSRSSASTYRSAISLAGSPSSRRQTLKPTPSKRARPSPVPIHRWPLRSSASAWTMLEGSPSPTVSWRSRGVSGSPARAVAAVAMTSRPIIATLRNMLPASPHPPVNRHPRNGAAPAQPRGDGRMRLPAALLGLCAALAMAGQAAAQARTYALDPVHTRVMFAVDHAGFSRAMGTVSGTTGVLRLDPGDWSGARVEARVPLQRLELGDDGWNRAALAGNLLDAGRHPHAVFVSERVEPLAETRAYIHGNLTLAGVTRPVTLEAVLNTVKR